MAELGVLQPILVRRGRRRRYELIAGERRWRAAKRAGLPSIPVVVRTVDEVLSLEQALVENLHREDLNAARGGGRLPAADGGLRPHARRGGSAVGKSRATVTNTLRLPTADCPQ
jgi:ParB family transcriptional regulator, chromosome partitioning protein